MKKGFYIFLTLSLFFAPFVKSQTIKDPFSHLVKESKKSEKEEIRLQVKAERSSTSKLPDITLFKKSNNLDATIFSGDSDIKVQILHENKTIVYEATINQFQHNWQLNIEFLQPDTRYIIKFIPPKGGYLFGSFYK